MVALSLMLTLVLAASGVLLPRRDLDVCDFDYLEFNGKITVTSSPGFPSAVVVDGWTLIDVRRALTRDVGCSELDISGPEVLAGCIHNQFSQLPLQSCSFSFDSCHEVAYLVMFREQRPFPGRKESLSVAQSPTACP